MYPEDRVLVAVVPRPRDFETIIRENWYRIPQEYAPKGLYAEYIAFYFGQSFGAEKWAIHYYARNLGHELVTRRTILPEEPSHPRADRLYYRLQLGPIQRLPEPIISLRWRRLTFVHTTWDRFMAARELNDLFLDGGEFVDRLYATLKECGMQPERSYEIHEPERDYTVPMLIPCQNGRVELAFDRLPTCEAGLQTLVDEIVREVESRGGSLNEY